MDKIAIYGAGGFGLEVAMLIEQINAVRDHWEIVGFFDDAVEKGRTVNGYPVLGDWQDLNEWREKIALAVAIGNPKTKRFVIDRIINPRVYFPTLIHPSTISGKRKYVEIGHGCIICAGCIITTNITIGNYVILNLACTVGHETRIDDYSSFMPTCNISGEVNIGQATYWGTGAKIINRISVGDEAVIGAGAVVVEDIPAGMTAVGVPAKPIKKAKFSPLKASPLSKNNQQIEATHIRQTQSGIRERLCR